jgi:hypothetical protein
MARCLSLLLSAALPPLEASAALGGDMESVQADQAAMGASQQGSAATEHISAATENYTVYELQTPAGITVREYLSLSGTVFAIAWQGPVLPNLSQLLGAYFSKYTEAATDARHTGHGHLNIQLPDLVVESNGRVRAFFGRAYLPNGLPQGVVVSDIQ